MNESDGAVQHLDMVSKLSRQLASRGIAILKHQYDYLAFGSWVIVAGTRKHLVSLTWDGKESWLTAESCIRADNQSKEDWMHFDSRDLSGAIPDAVLGACIEIVLQKVTPAGLHGSGDFDQRLEEN